MLRKIWQKCKRDFENQPLAIVTAWIAIIVAVGIYIIGEINLSSTTSSISEFHVGNSATSISITILVSVAFSFICREVIKKTIVGGFFLSAFLSCLCILIFSIFEKERIINTSIHGKSGFEGPAIDLSYWSVFFIFLSITASSAIQRIFDTWGQVPETREDGSKGERGVSPMELIIFAAIWGAFLSGGQQKILGAFIFQDPPTLSDR